MDLWEFVPPDRLPRIPQSAVLRAPRDRPSDRFAHGLGGFARSFLKLDTGRVDNVIPKVGGDFSVLLS